MESRLNTEVAANYKEHRRRWKGFLFCDVPVVAAMDRVSPTTLWAAAVGEGNE